MSAAWHAPNRAHGFRTYFTEVGPRVISRTETEPTWQWGLALVGYGRGGRVRAVPEAALKPAENRIDYERGLVREWYDNSPRGLEQGFVVFGPPEALEAEPLEGAPPRGPRASRVEPSQAARLAHLDLRLLGTLEPIFAEDGQAVDFRTGRGVNLVHYAHLRVTDAGGRELPAWIEGFTQGGVGGVRLVFDDTEAAYPVTVDPLATSPAWTAEGNLADAYFGFSVATAGDVNGDGYSDVIVGAYGYDGILETDEGAAYVYHGSASGLHTGAAWSDVGYQAYAYFGITVSTAGDVNGDGYADVIVGAYQYDNGQVNEGRAFVYHGSATGLERSPAWTAEGDQSSAYFGRSASTAGDVNGDGYADVIVGAYQYDNGEANEGRAFVYHGSASGLETSPAWTAESDQASAFFGMSVSTAGDVNGDGYSDVIVGAYSYDNGETDEGRAYVFHGSPSGLETTPAWTAESNQAFAEFGYSVSTAGDVNGDGYSDVIVGAFHYDNGETDEGRAFVYHGSASGLETTPAWTAESDQTSAYFGGSVSTAGDVNGDGYADVIVGAYQYDNGEANEGRAFVYHGSASGLETTPAWTAESDQASASFGKSVSTAGDVNGDGYSDVIVGAYLYDNGEANEGRAFVYHGSASGLEPNWSWRAEAGQDVARFGCSASTAGDVNGDGYADVIVGAEEYDNGQAAEGAAFVYHGSASGLETSAAWTAESDQAYAYFGHSVSTAGDVNGDGYADVIVGAYYYDNGEEDEGRAFVYHGSPAGLETGPAWTAESDLAFARFGSSVSTAGDVNGDGYADVIVGAYHYHNGEATEGRAFVYHGSASGLGMSPAWTAESNQAGALFGYSVSTAGDVNGDGYSDVIVGAYLYDNGQSSEGRAYVYHGSPAGLETTPAWTAESDQTDAEFGHSVSTAGDVNGDGYADVIVGAPYYDSGETDEGRAYVYHGSATGLETTPAWTAESNVADARFGWSVSTAGDVNGDGYADVIVAPYSSGQDLHVFHGSASGLGTSPAWTAATIGGSPFVSTAGDVNGDGYAEVVVGEKWAPNGGRAYVYYGNGGPGLSLKPEQRRADDAGQIARLGHTRTPDGFRLAAIGRSPFGRAKVKLECEAKPARHFLDGSNTQASASWFDTGTSGVSLNELVADPEPGRYHWRVRLLYDPVTSPFAQASRWFTIPWGGQEETDLAQSSTIGGVVWLDADGDGIRQSDEAMLGSITVQLLDEGGTVIDQALTNAAGEYVFVVDPNASHRVRFVLPTGYQFTLKDQGVDDTLDSDADPVTGETDLIGPPYQASDSSAWSAGMRQEGPCLAPDEEVYIYSQTIDANGNNVLHFQDPNQPDQVTGYNVYRSSDASLPPDQWPLIASNVTDMDEAEPNIQWVDSTGDTSPTGIWYYEIAAYNAICDAEGPR
ncbi:MAG: hypothetical protein D6718_10260 [Acidobacteria bacterium]|nr:MAG: hypothetical protein D6718_10260 [Acidobacteriota bacterium]